MEFGNGQHAVIDWKKNNMNQANSRKRIGGSLISNILLANFRYAGNEDTWSRFRFGVVVYYQNAYLPDLPITKLD